MSTAAILAGGQARRLGGRSKALLPLGHRRIIDHLLAVLHAVVDDVFIVANDHDRYEACGVPVHPDLLSDAGPLGGVHAALARARSAHILVVAGDMPFLRAPFLTYLLRQGQSVDIAIPRTGDGYQPLCASYRRSCLDIMADRIGARALKMTAVLAETSSRALETADIAPFDPHGTLFFNINTPADYARALTLAAYHSS